MKSRWLEPGQAATSSPGWSPREQADAVHAINEYLSMLEAGERPDRQRLLDRYPQIRDDLAACLDGLELMHRVAPDLAAPLEPERTAHAAGVPAVRSTIGDYRIVRQIGRGGMGAVFEAEQVSLGRRVALKVLPFAAIWDPAQLQRFKFEAQAAAQLHHSNIVPVFSIGCEQGVHYYAMQFIEGWAVSDVIGVLQQFGRREDVVSASAIDDLTRNIRIGCQRDSDADSPPSEADSVVGLVSTVLTAAHTAVHHESSSGKRFTQSREYFRLVARLGTQVADALSHAHNQGIIHRDVKPANLILDTQGSIWITDFGLARLEDHSLSSLTLTGDIVGTLRYMSPEQALGKRTLVDHRSDIYALAATLYEMLTLRPAQTGTERGELLQQIAFSEPPEPRQLVKSIPADLETIVLKAMAKDRVDRYETAGEVADDLRRFLDHKPILARRQTRLQRVVKWSARHKSLVWSVGLASMIVVLLLAVAAALIASKERQRRLEAENAARQELALRDQITSQLAISYLERGQELCEQGQIGLGISWLARSLDTLPAGEAHLDRSIRLNLATWRNHLHSLETVFQHPQRVSAVAFDPRQKRILTGCEDTIARFWDLASGQQLGKPMPHGSPITDVAVSPDGAWIATGGRDGTVRLWNAVTQTPIGGSLRVGADVVLAFTTDSRQLITGSSDGAIRLWEAPTASLVKAIAPDHREGQLRVRAVAACSDKLLIVVTADGSVFQLFDVDQDRLVGAPMSHSQAQDLAINSDGSRLATGGSDGTIRVWDTATGQPALPSIIPHGGEVFALAFSADGARLVSGGSMRRAQVWDAATGEPIGAPLVQGKTVLAAAFSLDGRHIVTGNAIGEVRVWKSAAGQRRGRSIQHRGRIMAAAYGPERLRILTETEGVVQMRDAVTDEPIGHAWNVETAGNVEAIAPRLHPRGLGQPLVISPDGTRLLTSLNTVSLWNISTGERIGKPFHFFTASRTFSPDGTRILTAGQAKTAVLSDAVTANWLGQLLEYRDTVSCAVFSPDGTQILTGDYEGMIRQWDANTLQPLAKPWRHGSAVKALAIGPDGQRILIGFADGTARLWNVRTRKPCGPVFQHQNFVCAVTFSPDGSRALTCSLDGEARLWDAKTFRRIGPVYQHDGWHPHASFSPDGCQFLLADAGGSAQIWDLPSGPIPGNTATVTCWTQVITGLRPDASGEVIVLDRTAWWGQRERLQALGGAPDERPPAKRLAAAKSLVSCSMQHALRGLNLAQQDLWDDAMTQYQLALELSGNSPTLCRQIAHWNRQQMEDRVATTIELKKSSPSDSPFDWAAYRGKTVLIGIWPKREESNQRYVRYVIRNCELYRDRGFEVLQVDCPGIEQAGEAPGWPESLPWQTFRVEEIEGLHPAARYFGFVDEPMGLLVDEQGKLLSTDAMGYRLELLLAELLGPPQVPTGELVHLDLQARSNAKLSEVFQRPHFGDLRELPLGDQELGGVRFRVADALIQLAGKGLDDRPALVAGIPVDREFVRLYVLHGTGGPDLSDGTVIGHYHVFYADETSEIIPIVYGTHVRHWVDNSRRQETVTSGTAVWAGQNRLTRWADMQLRLFMLSWRNPHPDKRVVRIDYSSVQTDAWPFCVAMTVEAAPAGDP